MDALVNRVEQHLARAPEDGRGWDVLAPVYLRLGRAAEAEQAYRNAVRLLGSSAARQAGLGEAILAGSGGVVTEKARAAFEAALAAEPAAPGPRFYLALAKEQEGKPEEAAAGWRALLAEAPADAPWRPAVEQALARVGAVAPPPGPDANQVAEAAGMTPADRSAMIEGMVDGLAERLQSDPEDVEGWLKLIRSYTVLGRTGDASAAGEAALRSVTADADRKRVEGLMADLGLQRTGAAAQ
jgi:cytochrome c-type biogenesis protein CcmH